MLSIFTKARQYLSNLPIYRKGLIVITIPVLSLLGSACLFSYAQWNADVAEGWVKHTLEVEKQLYLIAFTIPQARSAVRDDAANDTRERAQYQKAKQLLPELLDRVETLTLDNPSQTARVRALKSFVNGMLARLDAVLANPSDAHDGPLSYQQGLAKNQVPMTQAVQLLGAMLLEEERLLTPRTAARNRARRIFGIAIGLSLGLGLIGAFVAVRLFTSGISRRIQVLEGNADRLKQGLPLTPLPPGRDEIGRLGMAMEKAGTLLAEKSERLKLALKMAKIAVWELDPRSGEVRYEGKDEFIEITGYPSELLAPRIETFFNLVDPREHLDVEQEFAKALANKTSFRREFQTARTGDVDRSISLAACQYSSGQASSTVLGVIMDITDRKQAEQVASRQASELAESEQRLRGQTRILQCVVDSMVDGVAVADRNGKFLVFNPAAEKILGRGALEGGPDEWPDQYGIFSADQVTPYPASEIPLARALHGYSVDGVELFVRHPKLPEGAWISATARPLKDEDNAVWGGAVVFGDITERKRGDQELRAAKLEAENANRAKSEFLSRMSHELRTPLNSILGFSQILKMHDLTERPRECVEHILKGGTHLLGLIDEVLDIARIEAGRMSLSPEPVSITDSLHQVLDMVRPLADARAVRLVFDRPRSCQQHVIADRQRLHQVLLNLLSNAVKYNRNGGSVDIFCSKNQAGQLRVSVRDTGAGISEADQARLFAPFERLSANQGEIQGSGLGLALSKRLMEVMGGKIGLTSQPGDGSTFWIELPCAEAPEEAIHRQDPHGAIEVKHFEGTRLVLYIEDNLSNMRLMEHIVSYRPHIRLLPAMQGRLGLDLARQHRPDLILLDLHLPDLLGDQVLKELQADPRTNGIPVVMISADATPGQVRRLLTAGVAAYITKPLNVDTILKVFDDYLVELGGVSPVPAIEETIEAKG
jgi:signal transduction histidine kinase/CheY-like chemotaxis protein